MRTYLAALVLFVASGCAGWARHCDSTVADYAGADWIVVQYAADGHPINCWKLNNTSIGNEHQSDGIFWTSHGHLVHISGWYNRIQVRSSAFDDAAVLLGVDLKRCVNGRYAAEVAVVKVIAEPAAEPAAEPEPNVIINSTSATFSVFPPTLRNLEPKVDVWKANHPPERK